MGTKIKLFFETGSPYTWIAYEVLLRYEKLWDLDIELLPFALGHVFKAARNAFPQQMSSAENPRRAYMLQDLVRTGQAWGVPTNGKMPSNHLNGDKKTVFNTLPAQRIMAAALQRYGPKAAEPRALLRAIFHCFHNETAGKHVIVDEALLRGCCTAAGIGEQDTAALLEAAGSPSVSAAMRKNTAAALEIGAFGSPTMYVESPRFTGMVFGSDRFEQLAHLIGKTWYGGNPGRGAVAAAPRLASKL